MKKSHLIVLTVAFLAISGCKSPEAEVEQLLKESHQIPEPEITQEVMDEGFQYSGVLLDVTGGESSGSVIATYKDGVYLLKANFNVPDPTGTDFYEGWIVRQGSALSVVSTGKVEKGSDGMYTNVFTSKTDYTDHTQYVLTLEPDDGDPAPAKHIVEGPLKKQ